jgi:hypothetical protein
MVDVDKKSGKPMIIKEEDENEGEIVGLVNPVVMMT